MVGEACLPSNAKYPRTLDYTFYSGVHVCWPEHSDSSFVYGFMSLDYGLGTMTATTFKGTQQQSQPRKKLEHRGFEGVLVSLLLTTMEAFSYL